MDISELHKEVDRLGGTRARLEKERGELEAQEAVLSAQVEAALLAGRENLPEQSKLIDLRNRISIIQGAISRADTQASEYKTQIEHLQRSELASQWTEYEKDIRARLARIRSAVGSLSGEFEDLTQVVLASERVSSVASQDAAILFTRANLFVSEGVKAMQAINANLNTLK
jgi:chromosome segregation ATPase